MESLPSTSTVQQDVTTAASSAEVVVAQLGDQCLAVSADAPRNSRKRSAPSSDDEEATATPPELHLYSYDDATRSGTAVVAASAQLVRAARTRGRGVLAKRVALRKVSNTTLDTRDATSPARSRSAGAAIAEQGPAASLVSNQRAPELAPKRTKLNHAGALSATGRRRYPSPRPVPHFSLLVQPIEAYASSPNPSSTRPSPPQRRRANSMPSLSPARTATSSRQSDHFEHRGFDSWTYTLRPSPANLVQRRASASGSDITCHPATSERTDQSTSNPVTRGPRARCAAESPSASWELSQGDLLALHARNTTAASYGRLESIVAVSLSPPITKATLRELDLQDILRNPQLRHDSVFDPNLMFRPNRDGERGDRKRAAAQSYWTAVAREIKFGCRCTAYFERQVLPCLCLSAAPDVTTESIVLRQRLPSRVPPLIHELRAVLLSLLPTAAPSSSVATNTVSTPISASITRDQVVEALDPAFLSQQIDRGVLDVANLARFLGQVLKLHCAPMRDGLVDEMVKACGESQGDIVNGLRLCFEVLELMKLDIANHQLRSLRPYLLQTAVEFELRFFQDLVTRRRGGSTGQASPAPRTVSWLQSAVEAGSGAAPRSVVNQTEVVSSAVRDGILALVFEAQDGSSPSSSTSSLPETLQLDAYRLAAFHADVTDLTVVYLLLTLFRQLVGNNVKLTDEDTNIMRKEIWSIMAATVGTADQVSGTAASSAGVTGIAKLQSPTFLAAVHDAGLQVASRATRHRQSKTKDSNNSAVPDAATVKLVEAYLQSHIRATSPMFQLLQTRLKLTIGEVVKEHMDDVQRTHWWLAPAPVVPVGTTKLSLVSGMGLTSTIAPVRSRKRAVGEEEGDAEDDESASRRVRRRGSEDTSLSTAGVVAPSTTCVSLAPTQASIAASPFALALTRNGLSPLATEVRMLGERIARVTTFHVAVYKDWYLSLLPTFVGNTPPARL